MSDAPTLEVRTSPNGGCAPMLLQAIDGAKVSLTAMIYDITHPIIAQALVHAYQRIHAVRIITDGVRAVEHDSLIGYLNGQGVPVRVHVKAAAYHHKVLVVDHVDVYSGSFNWTLNAEIRNNENLIAHRAVPYIAEKLEAVADVDWAAAHPIALLTPAKPSLD